MASDLSYVEAACSVYCTGPLLEAVQLSGIFNDSKTFVDMPMLADPAVVLQRFENEAPTTTEELMAFLEENFGEAGSDLMKWEPTDLKDSFDLLDRITDPNYKQWAHELNQFWKELGRKFKDEVLQNPERHSFVPRNEPMVVPGGRFRESYYWDSYWTLQGLLVCEMEQTASYVIRNLLLDVTNFGFVPNGGRIYYLDRSQPPMLSEMVLAYFQATGDGEFVQGAFPVLEQEYQFWMGADSTVKVTVVVGGKSYVLNRYRSSGTTPRPEAYKEDLHTVNASDAMTAEEQGEVYRNLRTGAESGWDFTTRWIDPVMVDGQPTYLLENIVTSSSVPVELNAILYRCERNLARMAQMLADGTNTLPADDDAVLTSAAALPFVQASNDRREAMQAVLWDSDAGTWYDYDLVREEHRRYNTISNYIPMWAGVLDKESEELRDTVVSSLLNSHLIAEAGVLTTNITSGQQWDAPNAWPPLVQMTVEGLQRVNRPTASEAATDLTNAWLETCYLAYANTGYMYEKYNALEKGVGGGGGEYEPQIGFGWSNGAVLMMLNSTYPPRHKNGGGSGDCGLWCSGGFIAGFVCVLAFVIGGSLFLGFRWRNQRAGEAKSRYTNMDNM